jgi:membrane-bound serine protease (ClpP class)
VLPGLVVMASALLIGISGAGAQEVPESAGHAAGEGHDCADGVAAEHAAQARAPEAGADVVQILEVVGLVDPVLADFVIERIRIASLPGSGVLAVVLRVDSRRAVIDADELATIARDIIDSRVPVTAWVGPSGARATGEVAQLLALVDRVGVAPGARLGETGEQVLDCAEFGRLWGSNAPLLADRTVNHSEAVATGVVAAPAPTLGEFLFTLDDLGFETVEVTDGETGETRLEPRTSVQFVSLPFVGGIMHTAASPPLAYLLLLIALSLLLLEFYTAGVGIAGVVGAGCGILSLYGLAILPTNGYAIALIVFAFFAFAIDIQTGVPRMWTVIGTASVIAGTLTLYDGVSMSWVPMLGGLLVLVLGVVGGLPPLVRSRFSTPTIGREWMIGMRGEAVEPVHPFGVVRIADSLWRARTFRASPIAPGEAVEVTGIEGLMLEVSPVELLDPTEDAGGTSDGEGDDDPETGEEVDRSSAD